jgi:hypothetical protein
MSLDIFVQPENFLKDKEMVVYFVKSPMTKKDVNDMNLVINQAKAKESDIFVHHRLTDDPLTTEVFKRKFLESAGGWILYTLLSKR